MENDEDTRELPQQPGEQQVVPVIEEELVAGTRAVKTGSVRVRKEVEHLRKNVTMPVVKEMVKVNRVPVNRVIEAIPQMREEGDVLIIPVVEEEIVVQKRLVLKEEIHIHRKQVKNRATQGVTLEREHAVVERLDSEGNVIATAAPAPPKGREGEEPLRRLGERGSLFK